MKTSTIPSLRVEPALRLAAESVLLEGESLSSFVEQSMRSQIARRQIHSEFIARGLLSRDEAKRSGRYHSSDSVLLELQGMLAKAEAGAKK